MAKKSLVTFLLTAGPLKVSSWHYMRHAGEFENERAINLIILMLLMIKAVALMVILLIMSNSDSQ